MWDRQAMSCQVGDGCGFTSDDQWIKRLVIAEFNDVGGWHSARYYTHTAQIYRTGKWVEGKARDSTLKSRDRRSGLAFSRHWGTDVASSLSLAESHVGDGDRDENHAENDRCAE